MRTPSKSERIINCTFSVLFLTCLFRTLFSGLFKKFVSACFKQVFIDGKTCENCFFVLFSWSLNIYARVVGIWGGVGKSWRQTADVLLSQIPKYFEKLWLHILGEDFFLLLSKNVFFLTSFEGLSYQIYVIYYAIFGLLNFRSIYFAYFHNTYLISSCCLIEWRIFLPASKATDGWIRNGRKGHIKQHFWRRKRLLKKKKTFGWGGWVRSVFPVYFGVKNHACSIDIRWTFFKIFFVKFTPLMAAEQTWDFFSRLKKKFAKIKFTLVQKQARNNFWFFLLSDLFKILL